MTFEVEFDNGWHRIDGPNGPVWYAVPTEDPEPPAPGEEITIPEGYKTMGMIEK